MPDLSDTPIASYVQDCKREGHLAQLAFQLGIMDLYGAWAMLDLLVDMEAIDRSEAWGLIYTRIEQEIPE